MIKLIKQNYRKNKVLYKQIENQLRQQLGEQVTINHVGSTAIPKMYGKNIIDILIGTINKNEFESIKQILSQNYYASKNSSTDIYQFFASKNSETGNGDIHLHLGIKNTQRYEEFLILRDYLLNNKEEVKAYIKIKKQLVKQGVIERKHYRQQKSEYVSKLIERAKNHIK